PVWEPRGPHGHVNGWGPPFGDGLPPFPKGIAAGARVGAAGAAFGGGYPPAEVCGAILRSAAAGRRELVSYQTLPREIGGVPGEAGFRLSPAKSGEYPAKPGEGGSEAFDPHP